MPLDTPRVLLNMIVKNETANLPRCLSAFFREGLPPAIDGYLIADTGSADGTPDAIVGLFAERGIFGRVIHVPFENFSQARNAALDAARESDLPGEYLLFCDADMEFVYSAPLQPRLVAPAYFVMQRHAGSGGLEYPNVRIVRRDVPATYRGVTHEYLDIGNLDRPLLDGVSFADHASGANRGDKFARDLRLLTGALKEDPDDSRSTFYLANTYFDLGIYSEAIHLYERRIALGGWKEERFIAQYRIALCHQRERRFDAFSERMLRAFTISERAEPLYRLAVHHAAMGDWSASYRFAERALAVPKPAAALFVEGDVYDWRVLDALALAAYYIGRKDEAAGSYDRLLALVPANERPRIEANRRWCD